MKKTFFIYDKSTSISKEKYQEIFNLMTQFSGSVIIFLKLLEIKIIVFHNQKLKNKHINIVSEFENSIKNS